MQAATKQRVPNQKTTFPGRLLPLLFILFSVCLLSIGAGRSVSGDVSLMAGIVSSARQDQKSGDEIWETVDRSTLKARVESASPRAYQVVELHEDALSRALASAPMEFTKAAMQV